MLIFLFLGCMGEAESLLHRSRQDRYSKLVFGAISGMVNAVDDPYTAFFTPKEK